MNDNETPATEAWLDQRIGSRVKPRRHKPKPTDEEIAREARDKLRLHFNRPWMIGNPDNDDVLSIILSAIKKAKE